MDNNARIDLERRLPKRAMALILAGGRGSRLKQLTDTRCKPAVYFGGHFRIIDFVLSNCMNSGLRRIGVLTQYKSHSLLRHLQRGWNFLKSEMHEFVDLIPAQQRVDEEYWYRGTADAVYQSLDIIKSNKPEYVVILAGDHIYKMDYARMLADHALSGAGVTVGCIEVDRQEAKAFGVMAIDENKKVTSFVEKPADPPAMPGKPDRSLASMGIYIFTADYLYRMLDEDIALEGSSHDFGKDIIPKAVGEGQVVAHFFQDSCVYNSEKAPAYWRDVGTIDAYWEANIDLTATVAHLDLSGTAAAGQVRAQRGKPSRRGHRIQRLGGLHPVRLGAQLAAVLQLPRAFLHPDPRRGAATRGAGGAQRPAHQGGGRPGLPDSRWPGGRRGSGR